MTRDELISRLEAEGGWTITNGENLTRKDQATLLKMGPVQAFIRQHPSAHYEKVTVYRYHGQWISKECCTPTYETGPSTATTLPPTPPTDRDVLAFRTTYDPDSEWVPIESGQLPEVGKHICLQDIDGYMYEAWLLPSKQWDIIKADVDSEVIIGMSYSVAWRNLFPPFEKSK